MRRDGRIGTKDFIVTIDENKGSGTVIGYSTYTFDDGSVTARFTVKQAITEERAFA